MSQIPAEGSRSLRLVHLANSFARCPTLQWLLGTSNDVDALAKIYTNIVEDEGTQPRPRLVIRHHQALLVEIMGYSPFAAGDYLAFAQFDKPTLAAINQKYSLNLLELTEQDFRVHLDNIMGLISDELTLHSREAGCLDLQSFQEYSAGQVDPQSENGDEFFELVWVLKGVGQP